MDFASRKSLRKQYKKDGYVVAKDLLSQTELSQIKAELVAICRGERGAIKGLDLEATTLSEEDLIAKYLAFHFPHKMSPLFHNLLAHPKIVEILQAVIGPNVKAVQSMVFTKGPGKPGQAWHQDEYYIPTRDRSLTGVWIAIDDATVSNGCLWVIPGSHRPGVIYKQRDHNDPRFDAAGEAYDYPFSESDAIPIELPAGSAVVFNGYLLHRSLSNTTTNCFRRALANHYMSAESLLPWDWDGRLSKRDDMRDIVLVAGEDPYAYKGIESLTHPFIRAEKRSLASHFNAV